MTHSTKILRAGSLALLLCSTSAHADVTAAQVWQDWKDYSASVGQALTAGSEAMEGDTLKLTNVGVDVKMPDGSVTGAIAEVNMREVGDGTVEITMSPEYPLVMKSTPAEGEPVDVNILIKMPDTKMIASGGENEIGYAITSPSIGISVPQLTSGGEAVDVKVDMTLNNVSGKYLSKKGEARSIDTDLTADTMTFAVSGADAGSTFSFNGTAEGINSKSTSVIPGTVNMADMAAALAAGFSGNGTLATGPVKYDFAFNDAASNMSGTATSASSQLSFNMDKAGIAYVTNAGATAISLSGDQIPFPVNVTLAETAFDVLMPVSKSDTPQDFRSVIKLVELAVNDEIWALVDPTAQLPHDPATLIIDANGTATLTSDLMDPAAQASGAPPGMFNSLNLNQLQLKAVGADLTGNGALTFDNADMTTYPGMPKPVGKVSLQLVGGNALLDKLVAMGLIPEDQAMSARMMLGLFARPGEGEDSLVSEIEMGADGSVMANGQRLK